MLSSATQYHEDKSWRLARGPSEVEIILGMADHFAFSRRSADLWSGLAEHSGIDRGWRLPGDRHKRVGFDRGARQAIARVIVIAAAHALELIGVLLSGRLADLDPAFSAARFTEAVA